MEDMVVLWERRGPGEGDEEILVVMEKGEEGMEGGEKWVDISRYSFWSLIGPILPTWD